MNSKWIIAVAVLALFGAGIFCGLWLNEKAKPRLIQLQAPDITVSVPDSVWKWVRAKYEFPHTIIIPGHEPVVVDTDTPVSQWPVETDFQDGRAAIVVNDSTLPLDFTLAVEHQGIFRGAELRFWPGSYRIPGEKITVPQAPATPGRWSGLLYAAGTIGVPVVPGETELESGLFVFHDRLGLMGRVNFRPASADLRPKWRAGMALKIF